MILAAFLATTATQLGLSDWLRRRTYRPRRSVADRPEHTVKKILGGEATHGFQPPAAYGWVRAGRAHVAQDEQVTP